MYCTDLAAQIVQIIKTVFNRFDYLDFLNENSKIINAGSDSAAQTIQMNNVSLVRLDCSKCSRKMY